MFKYAKVSRAFNRAEWQTVGLAIEFKSFPRGSGSRKPVAMRRQGLRRLAVAGLVGALLLSFVSPANAFTASTSSSSYVDVPFNCEAKLYQIGTPSSNYPVVGGNINLRLFTYAPLSNTFTPSEKYEETMPAITHAIGYNTSDNFLYGIFVTNPKRIVRIDATGNVKKLGPFRGATL